MPDLTTKTRVDLEDLAMHEGAPVLLRRALAEVAEGEFLEVSGSSPGIADDLAVWCRKEGHGNKRGKLAHSHRIQHGASIPTVATSASVSQVAEPGWGLAPRGALIEIGGPEFSFTLREKREIWAQELDSIYRQATNNQWSVRRDIPWNTLPKLPLEIEAAVCQLMTFLTENEFAALYVPARFISRIHPHYREVVETLAMQVVDEARHAEAFTHRAEAGGLGLGTTAITGQLSLQTLLEEPDFTTAIFLLCVMGEGTFLTLLKFLEQHAQDPVTALLAQLAHRDEARHVAFGIAHLRYVLNQEPNRRRSLGAAVERRGRILATVSGLSSYVYDALVILAGGGASPVQIRIGAISVAALHREMDHARRARLQGLGFDPDDAIALSAAHTKNFM